MTISLVLKEDDSSIGLKSNGYYVGWRVTATKRDWKANGYAVGVEGDNYSNWFKGDDYSKRFNGDDYSVGSKGDVLNGLNTQYVEHIQFYHRGDDYLFIFKMSNGLTGNAYSVVLECKAYSVCFKSDDYIDGLKAKPI